MTRKARPMTDWQDMTTAPMDGTEVLVWCEGSNGERHVSETYFDPIAHFWFSESGGELEPLGWQHKPKPPEKLT